MTDLILANTLAVVAYVAEGRRTLVPHNKHTHHEPLTVFIYTRTLLAFPVL